MSLVEMKNVRMTFNGSKHSELVVFECLDLLVEEGEFLAIVGPSGCGKTTLLKLLGDLLRPVGGEIAIGGLSPRDARSKRFFSFIFQNPVLLPWRTVRENVILAGEVLGDSSVTSKAEEFIGFVGLAGFENAYPAELSGGMRSRVAIARALSFEPRVLLMDEPFGALDDMTRSRMNQFLSEVLAEQTGTAAILVTHSIDEAVFLADRVVVLSDRPARIVESIDIHLGKRPRGLHVRDTKEFLAYRQRIEEFAMGRTELHGGWRRRVESGRGNGTPAMQ